MKKTYIARQAILDRNLNTIGYELFFRDSSDNKFPEVDPDIASSKLIIQNHIQNDIQTLCMDKIAFRRDLLSSIDIILSMPVAEIIKTMPLAKAIEKALASHESILGDLLRLTTAFISHNSEKCSSTYEYL